MQKPGYNINRLAILKLVLSDMYTCRLDSKSFYILSCAVDADYTREFLDIYNNNNSSNEEEYKPVAKI